MVSLLACLVLSGVCFFANVCFVDEDSEREDVQEAREEGYYDGREDQAYEDDGW